MPEPESPQPLDRRSFARRAAAATGAFFALLFGLPAAATVIDPVLDSAADSWVDAGPLSEIEPGKAKRFTYEVRAGWESRKEVGFLVREGESESVTALSATCTHLGCRVRFKGGAFACPCHHGHFTLAGEPDGGPVTRPLSRFETRVEAGRVKVRV